MFFSRDLAKRPSENTVVFPRGILKSSTAVSSFYLSSSVLISGTVYTTCKNVGSEPNGLELVVRSVNQSRLVESYTCEKSSTAFMACAGEVIASTACGN